MRYWGLPLVVLAMLLPASTAASGATLVPLAPSAAWDSTPTHAASPPGDPRLFVVEPQAGCESSKTEL